MLINNAGTVGDLSKSVRATVNLAEIRRYAELNFVSFAALTAGFISKFAGGSTSTVVCVLEAPLPLSQTISILLV